MARTRNSAFMDACQLIRKHTKMDVAHLTNPPGPFCLEQNGSSAGRPKGKPQGWGETTDSDSRRLARSAGSTDGARNQRQLAARWSISEATLERWRSEGIGPRFLKLCGRVLYRQVDIEAYEESCLATSTKTAAAQAGAG